MRSLLSLILFILWAEEECVWGGGTKAGTV